MANRRNTSKDIPVASVTKMVGIFLLLGLFGLCYVDLSNRVHRAGDEITKLEAKLTSLQTQNDVVRAKISQLASRTALERRRSEGFIAMVPVTADKILRVNIGSKPFADDEIRTVANEAATP